MSIYVRARFDVLDGRQKEFEGLALAVRQQAADEPGTYTFRWFSAGGGSYLVLEEYADEAAALGHNERAADLLAGVAQCAKIAYVEIYGTLGPQLREWVQSNPQATSFADFPGHAAEG